MNTLDLVNPFPVRFAEKLTRIEISGPYDERQQVRTLTRNVSAGTSTQAETGTGGSNDTDTSYDYD